VRRLIPKRSYLITAKRLAPAGSRIGRKVAATIDHLLEGWAPADRIAVMVPPSRSCWAVRVPGTALVLWYTEGEDFVALHALKLWGDW
jgi:hypothetical protein